MIEFCKGCGKDKPLIKTFIGNSGYSYKCCFDCGLKPEIVKNLPRSYVQPLSASYLRDWQQHRELHSR